MNIIKISGELFDKPEEKATLSIYGNCVYLSADAEKFLELWYGTWKPTRGYDLYIDKDNPTSLYFRKIENFEIPRWHFSKLLPSFYIRRIYERLNLDRNLKLIFSLVPKVFDLNGLKLYEFKLIRAESILIKQSIQVNVNLSCHNFQ